MKKTLVRVSSALLAASLCLGAAAAARVEARETAEKPAAVSEFRRPSYAGYRASVPDRVGTDRIVVTVDRLKRSEGAAVKNAGETGYTEADKTLWTDETGFAEYEFEVKNPGLYRLRFDYYPAEGKRSDMVRTLLLDGEIPFEEARELKFKRIWESAEEILQDARGNDIRPAQAEAPAWISVELRDAKGYSPEPLEFYLTEGKHRLRLESVREPMLLGNLTFLPAAALPDAETYKAETAKLPTPAGISVTVEGEAAVLRSDAMLYPQNDRSSASTYPNDPAKIRLNTIGGSKWQTAGQWIEWRVEVPRAGLYKIAFKYRQNVINGAYSSRILYVNGRVPVTDAARLRFPYATAWETLVPQSGGEDLLVYLEEGENTLRLEVTLGDLAELVQKVDAALEELNQVYREIFMITGPSPDVYRDYAFHREIPDTLIKIKDLAGRLDTYHKEYVRLTGADGEQAQLIKKMARLLAEMNQDPDSLARRFAQFKNNITALGTWLLVASQQPLEIDRFWVLSPDMPVPETKTPFFEQLAFSVKAFAASFREDYSMVSGTSDGGKRDILVWIGNGIGGGRDQAQILKRMIDNDFAAESGYNTELQLVAISSLLTATLAGKGPDVALTLAGSDPVNYAVRNAVLDLSGFEGFKEVRKRFPDSALVPLSFENGVYGLPETQTYYMMFYRKDILHELGLSVPETWQDVIEMLPVLQKKQMNFGLPQVLGETVGLGFHAYAMFLYQNGGSFYRDDSYLSALNSKSAVNAFALWTKFYTDYALPRQYDFANRFRVGEVPVGIADYTMYNMLSVFAPEINGLWEWHEVPGIRREDGTVDRSVAGNVTASAVMADTKNPDAAWAFLKWWTDAATQTEYGLELESILGTAGRYSPANTEALSRIPWSRKEFEQISRQRRWVKGVPEVPGGYVTPRYTDFAFRKTVNASEDPGESLEDAARAIDTEIEAKLKEFNIRVRKSERE